MTPNVSDVKAAVQAWLDENNIADSNVKVISGKAWKARGETLGDGAYAVMLCEGRVGEILSMMHGEKLFNSFSDAMDKADLSWEPIYQWAVGFYQW